MGAQVAPSRQGAAKGQAQYVHWAGKRAGQLWGLLSRRRDPFPNPGTAQREQTGCQTKEQQCQQSMDLPGTRAELGLGVKAMVRLPCVGEGLSEAAVLLASHGPVSGMSRVSFNQWLGQSSSPSPSHHQDLPSSPAAVGKGEGDARAVDAARANQFRVSLAGDAIWRSAGL